MFIESLAQNTQLYFLIFARIFSLLTFAPVISSSGIPSIVRAALALFTTVAIFPMVNGAGSFIHTLCESIACSVIRKESITTWNTGRSGVEEHL